MHNFTKLAETLEELFPCDDKKPNLSVLYLLATTVLTIVVLGRTSTKAHGNYGKSIGLVAAWLFVYFFTPETTMCDLGALDVFLAYARRMPTLMVDMILPLLEVLHSKHLHLVFLVNAVQGILVLGCMGGGRQMGNGNGNGNNRGNGSGNGNNRCNGNGRGSRGAAATAAASAAAGSGNLIATGISGGINIGTIARGGVLNVVQKRPSEAEAEEESDADADADADEDCLKFT